MANPNLVLTEQLTKRYGSFVALDHCSLSIREGEVFGLLGPNGAGKTTLLRILLGFLRPTSGRATIDGLDCYRAAVEVHRRVAYMPGEARLFRQLRASEVLRFFADVREEPNADAGFRLADRLQLDVRRRVAWMSTGMRQKLALAVTLAANAKLMILDEPTTNLDPNVRSEVITLVKQARAAGRTVLFSSHVLSEVEEACDRVAIVRAGELVHIQSMAELRRQHRIRATLRRPLPAVPQGLHSELVIRQLSDDTVVIDTSCDLSRLFEWLACLSLDEITVEPFGLRAVYDRFHGMRATDLGH